MKHFMLDDAYFTGIMVNKEGNHYADKEVVTDDDLVKILKGWGRYSSTTSIDHPEFTKLREQLEAEGCITIQRSWWNGDKVLVPFTLNDMQFKKGDQFSCAAALGARIEVSKKNIGR